jgi:hypothetical protein
MCIMLPPPPIMPPIMPGGMSFGWWCIMFWFIMPPSE